MPVFAPFEMVLYDGTIYDVSDPQPLTILQIATILSRQHRWNGNARRPYTVAQHSVAVARDVMHRYDDRQQSIFGLLHDAAEAIIGDIPYPVKSYLNKLCGGLVSRIEDRVQGVILEGLGFYSGDVLESVVKDSDLRAAVAEVKELMPMGDVGIWQKTYQCWEDDDLPKLVPGAVDGGREEFLLEWDWLALKECEGERVEGAAV